MLLGKVAATCMCCSPVWISKRPGPLNEVPALKSDEALIFRVAPDAIWIAPLFSMPWVNSSVPVSTLSVPMLSNWLAENVKVPVEVSRVNVPLLVKLDWYSSASEMLLSFLA